MVLTEPPLDVSFWVLYEGRSYVLYASTSSLRCLEFERHWPSEGCLSPQGLSCRGSGG